MLSKAFWNFYALCYDSLTRLVPYKEMIDDIVALANLQKGMRILDAGCGTGNLEAAILKSGVTVDIVALDYSESMLAIARRKTGTSVKYLIADLAQPLQFGDGEFDVVFCNNVLYAIDDYEGLYKELSRVAKDGTLILSTPKADPKIETIIGEHIRKAGFMSLLPIILPLILVGLFNLIIVRKGNSKQQYHFLSRDEIVLLTGREALYETYAGQNWLAVRR